MKKNSHDWKQSSTDNFWGEIAPCDHVVQIYENDGVFLDALAGFVGGGINADDCVIVIATEAHLKALNSRLTAHGIYVESLVAEDRYIPLNAEQTLDRFMINNWPDEELFTQTISGLMKRAGKRRVRAFGEMVAILWAEGHNGATLQLEQLWNKFCLEQAFCLFCAYPKIGFTQDINDSVTMICDCHTKMIEGSQKSLTKILYRELEKKEAV